MSERDEREVVIAEWRDVRATKEASSWTAEQDYEWFAARLRASVDPPEPTSEASALRSALEEIASMGMARCPCRQFHFAPDAAIHVARRALEARCPTCNAGKSDPCAYPTENAKRLEREAGLLREALIPVWVTLEALHLAWGDDCPKDILPESWEVLMAGRLAIRRALEGAKGEDI